MPVWLIPWAIKGFILAAVLAAFTITIRGYNERLREVGRTEIRTAWEADKAARIKRTTEIVLQDLASRDRLEASLAPQRTTIETRTVTIIKEIPSALGPVAGIKLPFAAVRLFNDAVSPGLPAPSTGPRGEPAAESAEGPTVADLESVCVENAAEQLIQTNQLSGLLQRIKLYNASLTQGSGK